MTANELATAAEHGIETVSVISNDGSLSGHSRRAGQSL